MSLREQREKALKAAQEIAARVKGEGRTFTPDEAKEVQGLVEKADAFTAQIKDADDSEALMAKAFAAPDAVDTPALSGGFGGHVVGSDAYKSAVLAKKAGGRFSQMSPEFQGKVFTTGVSAGLTQTQYGQTLPNLLRRPTVADLLASGTMSATTLTYYEQGATTGAFTTVDENGLKPELNFDFDPVIETLSKIAGWTKITDEAFEDTPYLVSVIESQLLLLLALAEEDQILNGSGGGTDLTGILNRSGILTESAATVDDNLDALFRAMTAIQVATEGLSADAIVVNPLDYQTMRLERDANDQYYGGGPFTGAYGNGGLAMGPNIWGQRTVVTTAIDQGTALVGAFAVGGQVLRKGGVSVEMTNSDADDFRYNRVAIRAEERLALAVYRPAAFCEVTLATSGS